MFREILAAAVLLAPVGPTEVLAPFERPATEYGRGHRGADYAATVGQVVVAPLSGIVSFTGRVNDRDVVSIRAGRLLVSLEPVTGSAPVGTYVVAGQVIGTVGAGGHCSLRCVHLGLRIDGVYVDPLQSRRRLLPY